VHIVVVAKRVHLSYKLKILSYHGNDACDSVLQCFLCGRRPHFDEDGMQASDRKPDRRHATRGSLLSLTQPCCSSVDVDDVVSPAFAERPIRARPERHASAAGFLNSGVSMHDGFESDNEDHRNLDQRQLDDSPRGPTSSILRNGAPKAASLPCPKSPIQSDPSQSSAALHDAQHGSEYIAGPRSDVSNMLAVEVWQGPHEPNLQASSAFDAVKRSRIRPRRNAIFEQRLDGSEVSFLSHEMAQPGQIRSPPPPLEMFFDVSASAPPAAERRAISKSAQAWESESFLAEQVRCGNILFHL